MKIPFRETYIMKNKVQRNVLSQKVKKFQGDMCAPPSNKELYKSIRPNERASLCTLVKGSLSVEAALILPMFLIVLFAFFSFFSQYASAAELKLQAAADAKKAAVILGNTGITAADDITIYKTEKRRSLWIDPFRTGITIQETAVCRPWIGFMEEGVFETYVYITPDGEVYHLNRNCTHLKLSIRTVTMQKARRLKNVYGQKYRKCELCKTAFGKMVYITTEGDCYHSERSCSGLKRTVRKIPFRQAGNRRPCSRCGGKES